MSNPFAMFQEIFGQLMQMPETSEKSSVALIYVVGAIIIGEGETGLFPMTNHGVSKAA